MDEYYRVPTLILLGFLVAVFAALYARTRTHRRLLWLVGWIMATLRMAVLAIEPGDYGIWQAVAGSCMMIAAAMFLGALSPATFGRRIRLSYAIPFSVPIVVFTVSTSIDPAPGHLVRLLNVLAVVVAVSIACLWGSIRHLLPRWFNVAWSIAVGAPCIYLAWTGRYDLVLRLSHSGISIMTAILVLAVYRRLSPGVIFTVLGFFVWSLPLLMESMVPATDPLWTPAIRILNLMKVITAVGMIVLVLEDEARENESAQRRDRRARREMEEYAKLDLAVEPQNDFGIQYSEVCNAVVEAARFRQAAIYLFDVERNLRLAASSGWSDPASAAALDNLGNRLSLEDMRRCWAQLKSGNRPTSGRLPTINVRPCTPGGDESGLPGMTCVHTIPIAARSGDLQGILLLAGLEEEKEPLLPEDLLPLELLVARLAASRENGLLSRSIARAEKLAGIGRLAGGVAHELNNPLTVVMGYAELIHESSSEERIRRDAGIIHSESQRMKQIIESLARFWKPAPSPALPLSIPELLTEVESLRRSEFERSHIRFDVVIPSDLPRILANDDQMRQILLQLLDTAATAARDSRGQKDRRVRMEATGNATQVQIVISDSGPGFPDPEKVFDPFFTIKPPGEGPALALSLCYSIVREHGGDLSAANLQPYGAAMVLELPTEAASEDPPLPNYQISAQTPASSAHLKYH